MDKMFFSILDTKLSEDFYSKKMRLNPSNEALSFGFKSATLLKWVKSAYTLQVQSCREYGRIKKGYQHAYVGFIFIGLSTTLHYYGLHNTHIEKKSC
jgi:hypothetical protein